MESTVRGTPSAPCCGLQTIACLYWKDAHWHCELFLTKLSLNTAASPTLNLSSSGQGLCLRTLSSTTTVSSSSGVIRSPVPALCSCLEKHKIESDKISSYQVYLLYNLKWNWNSVILYAALLKVYITQQPQSSSSAYYPNTIRLNKYFREFQFWSEKCTNVSRKALIILREYHKK